MANEFIIRNGFQSRGDSQITGSLDVTGGITGSYTGSFTGDGSGLTGVPAASGVFGIADASGSYTYYSDFQTAINAASAGETVEMFADVTVDSSSTVTLKNGVNINLNGHKYENINSGTVELITLPNGATVYIFNGIFKRNGGPGAATTNAALDAYNSPTAKIVLEGVVFHNVTSVSYYGNAEVIGGTFISEGTVSYGFLTVTNNITNLTVKSYGPNRVSSTTIAQNCKFISTNSTGMNIWGGTLLNCSITSFGADGVTTGGAGTFMNCSIHSSAGRGVYNTAAGTRIINCSILSTAGIGLQMSTITFLSNTTAISTTSWGADLQLSTAAANNCSFESTALQGVRLVADAKLKNCYVKSSFDDPTGHAVNCINPTTTGFEIFDCGLETINSAANAIYAIVATNFGYWGNNTYKGMTTPVNSVNANLQSNTPDAYGNILIG